jgi:BirA family biotin operon repressor/biotin-[acetyl-CoA-carboxylase] ligase
MDAARMAPWQLDTLWQRLQPLWPGLQVEWLPEVGSTNSALLEAARQGDEAACLLVAERQRAGRGRLGRVWQSHWGDAAAGASVAASAVATIDAAADAPRGARAGSPAAGSLTFSLRVPLARSDLSGLSLAVGLALAEALHPRIGLKWPNDLVLAPYDDDGAAGVGRKLGGILIETVPLAGPGGRVVVIGVGLNIAAPPAASGLAETAAGLCEPDPAATAARALHAAAPALLATLRAFDEAGFAALQSRYAARDRLAGRAVRVLQSAGTEPGATLHEGRALGVDEQGFLMVQTSAGVQRIGSGEVSVRPC